MSYAKVRYLKSLCTKFYRSIEKLDADSCITELTKLHGIGFWTASIFTMFYLGHEDVFATSDAAISRAISKIYSSDGWLITTVWRSCNFVGHHSKLSHAWFYGLGLASKMQENKNLNFLKFAPCYLVYAQLFSIGRPATCT